MPKRSRPTFSILTRAALLFCLVSTCTVDSFALSNDEAESQVRSCIGQGNFGQAKKIASTGLNKDDTSDRAEYNFLYFLVLIYEYKSAQNQKVWINLSSLLNATCADHEDAFSTPEDVLPKRPEFDVFAGEEPKANVASSPCSTLVKPRVLKVQEFPEPDVPSPKRDYHAQTKFSCQRKDLLEEALLHIKLASSLRPRTEKYALCAEKADAINNCAVGSDSH